MHFSTNFVMGKCIFRLSSADTELLKSVGALLLPSQELVQSSRELDTIASEQECCCPLFNLDTLAKKRMRQSGETSEQVVYQILDLLRLDLYKLQSNCVWFDAASLVLPEGNLLVLAGASGFGKTTLALALAVVYGWKIITEDITFIDIESGATYPLVHPFLMRAGWQQTLFQATGIELESSLADDWFFDRAMFSTGVHNANFRLLVKLELPFFPMPLSVESISLAEYLRTILPLGNFLRVPDVLDSLPNILAGANCYVMRGGTVRERMEALAVLMDLRPSPLATPQQ
jgi:hypothetical protein